MRLSLQRFQNALKQRQGFKVIAGIANHDLASVLTVVRAAQASCADVAGLAIDVAATPEIVKAVRAEYAGVLFASGVTMAELNAAVDAGADAVELGNFDALYAQGYYISAEEVLALATEMASSFAGKVFTCVTIPGHLSVDAQTQLASQLQTLRIDMVQTEGATRLLSQEPQVKTLNASEKARITLNNVAAIAQAIELPVMAASGMEASTVAEARLAGASAVGIGSAVNKLALQVEMEEALAEIQTAWAADVQQLASHAV